MNDTTGVFLIISVVIQCIFFIALIIMIVKLIGAIKTVNEKVNGLNEQMVNFNTRIEPVLTKVSTLVDSVQSISSKIDTNIDTLTAVVDKFKDISAEIVEFVSRIKSKAETPIFDTVNTIAAVSKGIKVFFDKIKSTERASKKFDENYLFEGTGETQAADDSNIDFDSEFIDINKELNDVRKKLEEMKKV